MIDKYVKQIIRGCGEKANFIIILKWDKMKEAIERILSKCNEKHDLGGLYIKGLINGVELNIFTTGKILLKGIKNEDELKRFLEKILS